MIMMDLEAELALHLLVLGRLLPALRQRQRGLLLVLWGWGMFGVWVVGLSVTVFDCI